jgi:hypothetical protein
MPPSPSAFPLCWERAAKIGASSELGARSQTLIQRTEAQRQRKRTEREREICMAITLGQSIALCVESGGTSGRQRTHIHTKRTQIYGVCESAALCRALIAICQPASAACALMYNKKQQPTKMCAPLFCCVSLTQTRTATVQSCL